MITSQEKLDYIREWRRKNWPRVYAQMKARAAERPEAVRENNRRWKSRNIEKTRESGRIYSKEYRKRFPAKKVAQETARRFLKEKAMPRWVDRAAIDKVYEEARAMTVATGVRHSVDHIWPLKGKGFTGLHVPWNLQVLPFAENASKRNKSPLEWSRV
jgi:hypothetical protein